MIYPTKKWVIAWSKHSLTQLGRRLPAHRVQQLGALSQYIALGHWLQTHGFSFRDYAGNREALFARVAAHFADERILYLEFGVFEGKSMRFWSRTLTHPESHLHGFDSFEGLPENGGIWRRRQFDVRGSIPEIPDRRVRFFVGWFDQTLRQYSAPPHDRLVINMDADLYSSTILVLRHLRPLFARGTYLYFDDLCQVDHEPRAFHDFMLESGLRFRAVGATISMSEAFFECTGRSE